MLSRGRGRRWVTLGIASVLGAGGASSAWSATTSTWVNPQGGIWSDGGNWSTNPFYPDQNNPSGVDYNAVLNPGGYSVEIFNSIQLNQLSMGKGVTASVRYADQTHVGGLLDVLGGAVLDGRLTLGGNEPTSFPASAFARFWGTQTILGTGEIVFDKGLTVAGEDRVQNINDGILTIGPTITIRTGTGSGIVGNPSNGNTGLVNNGTISSETAGQTITVTEFQNEAANKSLIRGLNGGNLNLVNLNNQGTISMVGGGTLTLDGRWVNSGVINATNSRIKLGGTFAPSAVVNISRVGSPITLIGTVSNSGSTLSIGDAASGGWTLGDHGVIAGGIVQSIDGTELIVDDVPNFAANQQPILDGTTLRANVRMSPGSTLQIKNGLTLDGGNLIFGQSSSSDSAEVWVQGTQTIGGSGQILFQDTSPPYGDIFYPGASAATLTLGPGITVKTDGGRAVINMAVGGLVNQGTLWASNEMLIVSGVSNSNAGTLKATPGGTLIFNKMTGNANAIQADGGTIQLNGTYVINQGTSASSGGTLTLDGTWSNPGGIVAANSTLNLNGNFSGADLSNVNAINSNVNVGGNVDNSNHTWTIDGNNGSIWSLVSPARFNGGTIATINGGVIRTGGDTILTNVTLSGALKHIGFTLTINTHLELDNAAISNQGTISFSGTQNLTGRGTLTFDAASGAATVINGVVGPDVVMQTGLSNGAVSGNFFNDGVMAARNGKKLTLGDASTRATNRATWRSESASTLALAGTWDNNGTIVVDQGTLELGGTFPVDNIGTVNRIAGAVWVTGAMNLNGTALSVDGIGGLWGVRTGGKVSSGAILASPGKVLPVSVATGASSGNVTFDAVRVDADARVDSGVTLFAPTGLELNGLMDFRGPKLTFGPVSGTASQSNFSGSGDIVFNGSGTQTINSTFATWELGADTSIRTGSNGGEIGSTTQVLTTRGELVSATATKTLTARASSYTNRGTFNVLTSAKARFEVTNGSNFGTIHLESGDVTIIGTTFTNETSGRIEGTGTLNVSGTTFRNNGFISPGLSPGLLNITGTYRQGITGSLVIEIGGTNGGIDYDRLAISGAALLDGTLDVRFINGFIPSSLDQFTFLTASSVSGVFNNTANGIQTPAGNFDLVLDGTSFRLTNFAPVPEPAWVSLMLVGCWQLGRRRSSRAS